VRYAAPLVVLAAIAMAPLLVIAARLGVAPDAAAARGQLVLGWLCAAGAWVGQLWLVAGVTPALRERPSQLGALGRGALRLARAAVPWALAVAAIAIGFAALVVPGCVLLVLLAHTGASDRLGEPPPAPLADSVASVRRDLRRVALIVVLLVVADLVIAGAAHALLVRGTAGKSALAATRTFVRAVVLATTVLAPIPAWLLARCYKPNA